MKTRLSAPLSAMRAWLALQLLRLAVWWEQTWLARLIDRMAQYLGRRGLVLINWAVIFMAFGAGSILDPAPNQSHFTFYEHTTSLQRAILWLTVPAIAIIVIFFRNNNVWRKYEYAPAYAIISLPPFVMLAAWVQSYWGYLHGLTEYQSGWARAAVYLGILVHLGITAGWMELSRSLRAFLLAHAPDDEEDE